MLKNFLKVCGKARESHYKLHIVLYVAVLFIIFWLFDIIGISAESPKYFITDFLYFFIANMAAELVSTIIITLMDIRKS